MPPGSLYDEDILAWSEQQAALLRDLARRRDLPNALDLENVAEEVESVGRSELRATERAISFMLAHLLKLAAAGDLPMARHWRSEAQAFHFDALKAFVPSMRQRMTVQRDWEQAVRLAELSFLRRDEAFPLTPPQECPFSLDALLDAGFDPIGAVGRLRALSAPAQAPIAR